MNLKLSGISKNKLSGLLQFITGLNEISGAITET